MKVLLIRGTGTISAAISRKLATMYGVELFLINRGTRNCILPDTVHFLTADINDENTISRMIEELNFDAVCEFIGFEPSDVERDFRLFNGKTSQYIFISSASAYNKMPPSPVITEGTSLKNPYWDYARKKMDCEEFLMRMYREFEFPVTIVRPSHTYDERKVPLAIHGKNGTWQVIKRIMEEKPVIINGDGTSLWTITSSEDFAKGFIGLIGNRKAIGEAFHITSDVSISWTQIYQIVANYFGVSLHPYYVSSQFLIRASDGLYDFNGELWGDKAHTVLFDNSKIKNAVPGFCATVTPEEGIRRTLDWCLSHKECQKEDEEFDRWCDRVISVLNQAVSNLK